MKVNKFSKMDEYSEKSKLWIAYLFVFISILVWVHWFYGVVNPLYKGLSAIVVLYICYTLLFKWKEITVDQISILVGLLAGSHLLSAIFNRSGHLIGNVIILHGNLCFAIYHVAVGNLKNYLTGLPIRFSVFLQQFLRLVFVVSRVLILFKIGEQSYYYSVMNGRL